MPEYRAEIFKDTKGIWGDYNWQIWACWIFTKEDFITSHMFRTWQEAMDCANDWLRYD